jgi:hypothetical protein
VSNFVHSPHKEREKMLDEREKGGEIKRKIRNNNNNNNNKTPNL